MIEEGIGDSDATDRQRCWIEIHTNITNFNPNPNPNISDAVMHVFGCVCFSVMLCRKPWRGKFISGVQVLLQIDQVKFLYQETLVKVKGQEQKAHLQCVGSRCSATSLVLLLLLQTTLHIAANSAFHPSGVGKWVPASAGKARQVAYGSFRYMYAGCVGKTVRSLENTCHTWAP